MRRMGSEEMMAYAAVVRKLEDWAAVVGERDSLIREGHDAGLSNALIARSMGLSRNTVIQVLGTDDEEGEQ